MLLTQLLQCGAHKNERPADMWHGTWTGPTQLSEATGDGGGVRRKLRETSKRTQGVCRVCDGARKWCTHGPTNNFVIPHFLRSELAVTKSEETDREVEVRSGSLDPRTLSCLKL